MARIYISATYSDLKQCREAVYRALRSMKHDVKAMEYYVAADERPLDKCLADVASCDLYVGIFAWRYGYVPPKGNRGKKSITELEYRHAVDKEVPCLIFLLHEDAPWPRTQMEDGDGAAKLQRLRGELGKKYTVSFFENCEQLAARASAAVANWIAQQALAATHYGLTTSSPTPLVSPSRLLFAGSSNLFGRDEQLQQLDDAWDGGTTNILSLVGWGGVGKTALVNHWLARMADDNYRGATRVFDWSFYEPGTAGSVVSADLFVEKALDWFGDPDSRRGTLWDKGERLARLVSGQRALLVLDGLEPLQQPPGYDEGRLKDQVLQALLRSLAASNQGLCVVTTRIAVADLCPFERNTHTRVELGDLSPEAGAQLLGALGVTGDADEMRRASVEFGGHSLALTLLGGYLSDVCGGDVRRRREVHALEEDVRHGGHAKRVMESYVRWFGDGPELAVLHMLGLFNRRADRDAVAVLRAAPPIRGLTDKLFYPKSVLMRLAQT